MPSVREIKRRIQSVKNIKQVTRALEAVSASKAMRAQQQAQRSRPYTQSAWEVLVNLAGQPLNEHPLLTEHEEVRAVDIVLITSDRGLAGSYNMNIIRAAEHFARQWKTDVRWITIGRKGRDYLARRNHNIIATFTGFPAQPSISDIAPIGDIVVESFLDSVSDQVFIAYTDFINVLTQRPVVVNLLPLRPYDPEGMVASEYLKKEPEQTVENREYIYEPDTAGLLDEIVPRFTALQIYQALLESFASEHAARMVAMRNASENAEELAEILTLAYNKARQLAITSEILDIVGGVEALAESTRKEKKAHEALSAFSTASLAQSDAGYLAEAGTDFAAAAEEAYEAASDAVERAIEEADKFIKEMTDELSPENKRAVSKKDNLKRIEGIGKKVEEALNASGITTFAQVAGMSAKDLERIVKGEHKVRIVGDAATWPKQAQYLVDGDEDGLKTYQSKLKGGREVK